MAGAQRRKAKSHARARRAGATYFRQKASSAAKKSARAEQKRIRAAARASKARASIAGRARTATRKAKSFSSTQAAAISRYFLSSDIMGQKAPAVEIAKRLEFSKRLELSKALNTGLSGRGKRARLSRFEIIKRNLMVMIRRLLSWFSAHSKSLNMTAAGRRALSQLGDLYDLLTLEAVDDESLLRLKVAYGEACYYVTQASRGYYKKHSGAGRENYRPYFDRFVDVSSG